MAIVENPYAVLRIEHEAEDESWTITDVTRPGFIVAARTLAKALASVPLVVEAWDDTAAKNGVPRGELMAKLMKKRRRSDRQGD